MPAVPEPATTDTAKIEIAQPRAFTLGAVLTVNAYGLFLAVPVFTAVLVVSVLQIGVLTALIPLLAIALTAVFLPFGLGNSYIARLVRSVQPAAGQDPSGFVVQLTLWPRLRKGIRAVLEDADDIGYLTFGSNGLSFRGDSVNLSVPFSSIVEVRPQNIGLRGLFVYGRRIWIVVSGLPNVESIEVAERSSWLLPTSRRITKQLYSLVSKYDHTHSTSV
jgi:hypothetical protein